jgi:hypothetical protein
MLNEEQQAAAVTLTGAQVVVALQIVNRLITTGGLKDVELSPVGMARDGMVAALQEATGVNFDEAKAQQEAMQRQRVAQAREAYAQQQAAAKAEAEAEVASVIEVEVAGDEAPSKLNGPVKAKAKAKAKTKSKAKTKKRSLKVVGTASN